MKIIYSYCNVVWVEGCSTIKISKFWITQKNKYWNNFNDRLFDVVCRSIISNWNDADSHLKNLIGMLLNNWWDNIIFPICKTQKTKPNIEIISTIGCFMLSPRSIILNWSDDAENQMWKIRCRTYIINKPYNLGRVTQIKTNVCVSVNRTINDVYNETKNKL